MTNNEIEKVTNPGEKRWATIVYLLQAISFFVGITFIAGAIINYLKMDEVRGTWVESHFRWQIKTFWYGIVLVIISFFTLTMIIGYAISAFTVFWVVFRIIYGWNKLSQGQAVPLKGYF